MENSLVKREDENHPQERRHRRHRQSSSDSRTPSPAESDSTVDLPERFDQRGRRLPENDEDPLTKGIQDLLSGKGSLSKALQSFGIGGSSDDNSDGGRRRRRRK